MKIKVVLEASEEGGFTVYVPSLPGCISEGDTESEALTSIRKAIELYLEPAEEDLFPADGRSVREVAVRRKLPHCPTSKLLQHAKGLVWSWSGRG